MDILIRRKHMTVESYKNYDIVCLVCGQLKQLKLKPMEGIPCVCDRCKDDLEAIRYLYSNSDGIETIKKLTCKYCGNSYYAPNEGYILCEDCYSNFSKIYASKIKDIVYFNCEKCGKEQTMHVNSYKEGITKLCNECYKNQMRINRINRAHKKKINE